MGTIALVGLGGNLGDAAETVRRAFQELDALPNTRLLRASRLYQSKAWGRTDQPDFINAVAMLDTRLGARELLDAMLDIEHGALCLSDGARRWRAELFRTRLAFVRDFCALWPRHLVKDMEQARG